MAKKKDPLGLLIRAIGQPTHDNIEAALSHPDLEPHLGALSVDDFQVLAKVIIRFITLSQSLKQAQSAPPAGLSDADAGVLATINSEFARKDTCDV